jgi:hypothetical protein
VHWSLDDVPYLAYHAETPTTPNPAALLETWMAAAGEDHHVTLTMHPEVIGRHPWLLARLLEQLPGPVVTHARVAARALAPAA